MARCGRNGPAIISDAVSPLNRERSVTEIMTDVRAAGASPGRRRRSRLSPSLLIVPALVLLVITYVIPVVGLLRVSFGTKGFSLDAYKALVADGQQWAVLGETLMIAALVTAVCALLSYPVAWMTVKATRRWQWIILILLTVPLWSSVLVRTFSWLIMLGRAGPLNEFLIWLGVTDLPIQFLYTRTAVVVGMVHVLLPFTIFPLYAVMRRFDDKLILAAETLGARRWVAQLLILFPMTLPGIAAGSIIVFLHAIGYFVPPGILGGLRETTYVMLIEQEVNTQVNWEKAAAMAVILLLVTALIVLVFGKYLGVLSSANERDSAPSQSTGSVVRWSTILLGRLCTMSPFQRPSSGKNPTRVSMHRPASLVTVVLGWLVIAYLLVPVLFLIPISLSGASFLEFPPSSYSLRWYESFIGRRDWMTSLAVSAQTAVITMVCTTVIGGAAAVGLARSKSRLAPFWAGVLLSPAIIPTLIIAVGMYFQFVYLKLVGTIPGLVLGHMVITLPVVVVLILGGLKTVDSGPERAARSLGAGPVRAFMSTTFAIVRPSIIAAALFAFIASFDDVTISLFISGVGAETLPKRMWESLKFEIDPTLSAISTLMMGLSVFLLAVSELVKGRDRERA